MIQRGSGAGLLKKATTAILLGNVFGWQHLQRDNSMKLFVIRFIDCAHATGTQGLDYSIVRDGGF
jgi:hypothetical protein